MKKDELAEVMHKEGIRKDDADSAAKIVLQEHRKDRDKMFCCLKARGLSFRQIARAFGVSHVLVVYAVRRAESLRGAA